MVIDGVGVQNNTIVGAGLYGIYVLSFTGHPLFFTPITGASTLLSSVTVQKNTVTDTTGFCLDDPTEAFLGFGYCDDPGDFFIAGRGIRFWAFNDDATAINGRIMKNTVNCLPPNGDQENLGIEVIERGSGELGTVENVKVVNNTIDSDCVPAFTDEGEDTKFPSGLLP